MRKDRTKITPDLVIRVEKSKQLLTNKTLLEIQKHIRNALFAYRWNLSEIEERTQDIMSEKILPSFYRYTAEYKLSTWVYMIVKNYTIDYYRSAHGKFAKRTNLFPPCKTDDENTGLGFSIGLQTPQLVTYQDSLFDQEATTTLLRTAILKLDPKYQSIIKLRFFEECSYEEIAEKLDIPLGTVKARLFRAKEYLYGMFSNSRALIEA